MQLSLVLTTTKWPDPNHSPSTYGELLSRVTECFYSGGDLTVNELMKQIDDYIGLLQPGALQFDNKKLGSVAYRTQLMQSA